MSEPAEGELSVHGGVRLRTWSWIDQEAQGKVLLVHGFGDHTGPYGELAKVLRRSGHTVAAYDQRGHGRSEGKRGHVESFERFLEDLDVVLAWARGLVPAGTTPFLYGHSMGGLVVLRHLQTRGEPLPGVVLSAPWLRLAKPVPPWKQLVAGVLRRLAPAFPFPSKLDPAKLTRDPERQRAHASDPLSTHAISVTLFDTIEASQDAVLADRRPVTVPTLVLVPEADEVVDPEVTLRWALEAGPRIEIVRLADSRHEPHQEIDRTSVFEQVSDWLERHGSAQS